MKFHNSTSTLVKISCWQETSFMVTKEKIVNVSPGETIILPDTTVDNYNVSAEDYSRIGGFRSQPYGNGKHSWTDTGEIKLVDDVFILC